MKCSCNAGTYGDNDNLIGYSDRKIRAGRDHICPECKDRIKKGDEFMFCSIFEENSIHNYKMCLNCWDLTKVFFKDGWVIDYMMATLKDYLWDNWSEDLPSDCISNLSPINRDRICDILQEHQEK